MNIECTITGLDSGIVTTFRGKDCILTALRVARRGDTMHDLDNRVEVAWKQDGHTYILPNVHTLRDFVGMSGRDIAKGWRPKA